MTDSIDASNHLEQHFKAFAIAGMRIGAVMLRDATETNLELLDSALRAGARLSVELTPLPAIERATLVLTEVEGNRHEVASIAIKAGALQ